MRPINVPDRDPQRPTACYQGRDRWAGELPTGWPGDGGCWRDGDRRRRDGSRSIRDVRAPDGATVTRDSSMATQMRAFMLEGFDTAPRLRDDASVPEPGVGEVLIRIHGSSVNPADVHVAMGVLERWGMEYRFPVTLGHDLAGVVERVGAEVSRYTAGDEVFGFISTEPILHDGTYADYIVVPENRFIARKPVGVGFIEAAGVPLAASTAWLALGALEVSEGDRLLIVGATGGVGGFAVQLAAARGAHVIATGLDEDVDYLRDLGASEIVSRSVDVVATVREHHPDGVEALFDVATPEPARLAALAGALHPGGRAASALQAAAEDMPDGVTGINILNRSDPEVLADLAHRIDTGELRAPVQHTYGLSDVNLAFEHLQTRHTQGKIAIAIAQL
jgi:NADPH2:quinone reductase